MVKVKIEDAVYFNKIATSILSTNKDKKSKFLYALEKSQKRVSQLLQDYFDRLEEKKIDNAGKDSDGFVIMDENGNYKFKPEGQKNIRDFIRKESSKEIEIEQFICKEDEEPQIELLTRQALVPFVFEERKEPKEEKK